MCRRLKLAIQPPGILIIWLDSDAKELFCLSHSNNTIVPSGSDCATLCNAVVTTVCVCVLVCLSARCFGCIVENYYTDVCVCVCLWHCASASSSMRLHFLKQGVFSAGATMPPVIKIQRGECSPKVTPFSGPGACKVAHSQTRLLRERTRIELFKSL